MNGRCRAPQGLTERAVADHLVQVLAELLGLGPDDIDPEVPLSAYGLDSMTSTWLAGELESRCGVPVERELLLHRPSVTEVAEDVAGLLRGQPAKEPG